ncbi:probable transmembrane ascorbate ferrireductase 3 [Punica granatum]|uniref:ascorbate ferrireductase (transmembrane) n=2 Tax=Punica granatum TaxID=22663 RepID=A0A218W5G9_PUNGR|nr:probable transmembrane ascorbate ferrireductase 3 [Punica granatum]OWM67783.1 hypothetical protein CDL15_Pgr010720 [Punica granatum]PKI41742.1 hypothetical protein CRG98_037875 [Punica granatum]
MDVSTEVRYRRSASGLTKVAHVFAITSLVLLLVWLLHYREGLNYFSDNGYRVFNVHPFLMVFGLVLFSGEALMAYKTVPAERRMQKNIHMFLNLIAFILGAVGIRAVFKYHNMMNITNLYSLHSWIGIITICAFGLQWVIGLFTFLVGNASGSTKARVAPWHVCWGRAIFYMAVCAALTGFMEKATFLRLTQQHEARVLNFTALSVLLFGIFVDLSVALGRYI